MTLIRPLLIVSGLLLSARVHADSWPIPRGPSREPAPYRYDPKIVAAMPRSFLDDAAACILYSGTTYLLEEDGTCEAITHEVTRLNGRKGIDKLGEYRSIYFEPSHEKLTLNEARVLKADGTIVPVEPRHVQLRDVATDFQVYDESKQLVISFPNLQVGDAYEVKWTVRGRHREFGGDFFTRYTFGDDHYPSVRDELRVRVPARKTLKFASVNGKVEPSVSTVDGGKLYHWSVTHRSELPRDEERPSREELRLQVAVSTFASWEVVGQWKQKLRADCWKCTAELHKVIEEVTRGMTTPEAKAKALTTWVRRHIRYRSRGPGGLGYTPHPPHQVLRHLYGDCKDQAQLLAVMLREIGLPVWLVTIGAQDDGQVLAAVPSPWGSHALLLTRINGKDHWIDTTVSLAPWDFLPRSDRDRQAYLTQEDRLTLTKTPAFTFADNRIEQTTRVQVLPDGASRCRREAIYQGSSAWSRRDRWLEVPAGERRRMIAAELQDAHARAKLLHFTIDERQLGDFDQPVRAELDFEIPRHFSGETREASFTDSPVYTWFLGYNLDVERSTPFVLPTPLESVHRYVIELPALFRFESVPEGRDIDSPWGFFKLKVVHDAKTPRRLELHMHLRLARTRVEKSEFGEFLRFQDEVSKAYRVWLGLKTTTAIADAAALEQALTKTPAEADTVRALAQLYLAHDRLDDARRVLDRALSLLAEDRALWELRVHASKDRIEEEQLYRTMVQRFPRETKYALALGAACVRRGEQGEAKAILTPLTDLGRGAVLRAAAHYQLAQSAFQQGQPAAALKHLRSALMADPPRLASNEAMQFKARVHESLGQTREAIQCLEMVVTADPTAREALKQLVRLELQADLRDAALDHLRRFTIAAGADRAALAKAAALHLELKRYEDALELATRAKDDRILGLVHLHRQELAQAVVHLDRCLDPAALAGSIRAHLMRGDLTSAARRAEFIRRLPDAGAELFALERDLATLLRRREQYLGGGDRDLRLAASVERFLCLERGLAERWPQAHLDRLAQEAARETTFAPLLALRGMLALEKGQLRQALTDAELALKVQPTEGRAYLVRGRVRLEQANPDAAVIDLRRAAELGGRQDPVVLHWLAAAMFETGRAADAIATQRLALLLCPDDVEMRAQLQRMEKR